MFNIVFGYKTIDIWCPNQRELELVYNFHATYPFVGKVWIAKEGKGHHLICSSEDVDMLNAFTLHLISFIQELNHGEQTGEYVTDGTSEEVMS